MPRAKKSQGSDKPRVAKDRKVWRDDEKRAVFDKLKEENTQGKRSENGWKTQSYARAADAVNKLHPEEPPVTAKQVKSAMSRVSITLLRRCLGLDSLL